MRDLNTQLVIQGCAPRFRGFFPARPKGITRDPSRRSEDGHVCKCVSLHFRGSIFFAESIRIIITFNQEMLTLMRPLMLFLLLTCTCPLMAQPVTIKFVVQSEINTELTSLTDLHVMTTHGPYNYQDISTMSFLSATPDSASVQQLRTKGIGVFLKTKFLKPITADPERAYNAKIKEAVTDKDSLWIKRGTFRQGTAKIIPKNAFSLLEGNPASHDEAARARSNYNAMQVVSFIGGALIGWPLGQAVAGKTEPQWGLAAGGAVLLISAGIPLSVGFKKHAQKAMTIYNRRTPATGSSGLSFRFIPSVNGGTVIVKF